MLEPTINAAETDVRARSTGDSGSPGDIDPDFAKLFAESLLFATSWPDEDCRIVNPTIKFNSVAAEMFLTAPASGIWENLSAVQPRPQTKSTKIWTATCLLG